MAPPYHPDCDYAPITDSPIRQADHDPPAVTVTLRASTSSSTSGTNPIRNITLRPDVPVIVGRSSKHEAKNLCPTNDNALYDCPVISRRHAEVELRVNRYKVEKHTISIKDTNSMHGTSVNGQKLEKLRPFELRVGDTIRLGDSVNRADSKYPDATLRGPANILIDNYEGVTLTLDCVSTATQKNTAHLKSATSGYGYESESGFDDDDDEDDDEDDDIEVVGSVTHTTPDQTDVKTGTMAAKSGLSSQEAIDLEEDDDDEEEEDVVEDVTKEPQEFGRSVFVPDSYADDSNAPAPHANTQFYSAPTFATPHEDEELGSIAGDAWPNDDLISEHSDGDVQSSDDEEVVHHTAARFNIADFRDHSPSPERADEEEDDDERPEEYSSKPTRALYSPEIGTLGDDPDRDAEATREAAAPARPHYDPVRGFQTSASSTYKAYTSRSYDMPYPSASGVYTDSWLSSKWDVRPTGSNQDHRSLKQDTQIPPSYSYGTPYFSLYSADPKPNHLYPFGDVTSNNFLVQPEQGPHEEDQVFSLASLPEYAHSPMQVPVEHSAPPTLSKKRKSSEISNDEPETAASEAQPQSVEFIHFTNSSELPRLQVQQNDAVPVVPSGEPRLKKQRMAKRPQNSMLRAAAIEAGKYTAGAIIGGIGLVTLLASPIGEALANC